MKIEIIVNKTIIEISDFPIKYSKVHSEKLFSMPFIF